MDGTTLQRPAADRTRQLPEAVLTHPSGEDWKV